MNKKLDIITNAVSEEYGVSVEDVRGNGVDSLKHVNSRARHVAMYCMRILLDVECGEIAEYFNRNVKTFHKARGRIQRRMKKSSNFRTKVNSLLDELRKNTSLNE